MLQRLNPLGGLPQTVVTILCLVCAVWMGGLPVLAILQAIKPVLSEAKADFGNAVAVQIQFLADFNIAHSLLGQQ